MREMYDANKYDYLEDEWKHACEYRIKTLANRLAWFQVASILFVGVSIGEALYIYFVR